MERCGDPRRNALRLIIVIPRTRYERAHPRDTVWRTRRKTALLSGLLGWLAILIYPAFLLIDCFAKFDLGTSDLKLALISMAAGLVLMGISMILQPPTRRVGTPQYRWRKWICPYRDVGSLTTSMAGGQSRAGGAVLVLVLAGDAQGRNTYVTRLEHAVVAHFTEQ